MGFIQDTVNAVAGLFGGSSQEEYEFSADPKLDADSARLLAEFKMLNARMRNDGMLASSYGGMAVGQYNDMLRREGSGR